MAESYLGGVHPFADLFPLMEGEPFELLCSDIKEHGLRDPIILAHDGKLVDGRNRWRACMNVGVELRYEWLPKGMSDVEILDLITSKNIHRRHLDTAERAFLGVEYKKRFLKIIGQGKRTDLSSPEDKLEPGRKSVDKAAAMVGVGRASIERAERILKEPDLKEKVLTKELTLNAADEERKRRLKEDDYKAPVIEVTRGGSKRGADKQVTAMLSKLSGIVHMFDLIDTSVFGPDDLKEFSDYVSALNSIRRKLTKDS